MKHTITKEKLAALPNVAQTHRQTSPPASPAPKLQTAGQSTPALTFKFEGESYLGFVECNESAAAIKGTFMHGPMFAAATFITLVH